MFQAAENPVECDSSQMHAWCYCHELSLVVKAGLKLLSIQSGKSNPTTEPNLEAPSTTFQLNNKDIQVDVDSADSGVEEPLDKADQVPQHEDDKKPSSDVKTVSKKQAGTIYATADHKVSFL